MDTAPSEAQWRELYADDVHVQDPTQEKQGIADHHDYFDFVGPTFGPVPLVGGFVRWLYGRFVA